MSGPLLNAQDLCEQALAGAGERVVLVEEKTEVDLRFANNTVTTNGTRRDRSVTVVEFDRRATGVGVGVASGAGGVDLAALLAGAAAEARSAAPADDEAPLLVGGEGEGFSEPPGETTFAVLSPVLERLGDLFGRAGAEGRVMAGFATHGVTTTYLATSTGIRRRFAEPAGSVQLIGRSPDQLRSAWAGAGTNDFDDVDLDGLEARVVQGLAWAERRVELPAGRYETILPPDAVADLIAPLSWACSGREAEEGGSVFSAPGGRTRIGERLSPLAFELRSDPDDARFATAPFVAAGASSADWSVFDNGAPIGRTAWIDGGELARLRYHRAGAARSGAQFTPPGGNLTLELPGATASLDELVAGTERGLLVTCLWYIREVDPATLLLTGLTRDGIYLVEGGEVVGAVNNFRFNESPVDLLGRAAQVGATRRALSREWGDEFTKTAMPALRIADFNMSSVSPAT